MIYAWAMRVGRVRHFLAVAVAGAAVVSCDGRAEVGPTATPDASATPVAAKADATLTLRSIARLRAGEPTLLAPDGRGGIFAVQPAEDGRDAVVQLRYDGTAAPIRLSAVTICQALLRRDPDRSADAPAVDTPPVPTRAPNTAPSDAPSDARSDAPPDRPTAASPDRPTAASPGLPSGAPRDPARSAVDATGEIQSLVALPSGQLLFFFNGQSLGQPRCCVGLYDPLRETTRILYDTPALSVASGMGQTIGLARGTLITGGDRVTLYLRHFDASIFLRFDTVGLEAGERPRLARAFTRILLGGEPIATGDDRALFGPLDGDAFCLTIPKAGEVYRVNARGEATQIAHFTGWPPLACAPLFIPAAERAPTAPRPPAIPPPATPPRATSAGPAALSPRAVGADRTIVPGVATLYFFPESPELVDLRQLDLSDVIDHQFPLLLIDDSTGRRLRERNALAVRPTFPVYALRLTSLAYDPRSRDVIAYDAMSGEVLRFGMW